MDRIELLNYLNVLLQPDKFVDYCPNGLQITGCQNIKKIVSGVSASQELLNIAVECDAHAVLVHHGYFWKGEDPCIVGIKRNRIATLLKENINLIAYHLPLDAHPIYGNNIQLAKVLDIEVDTKDISKKSDLILTGKLYVPQSADDFTNYIAEQLNRQPLHITGGDQKISKIALCTGGGSDFIEQVVDLNVDAFLTGEISERTVYIARETGIHLFAAGHYATERYGVRALGEHLAAQFNLEHSYVEVDNPV